jgi:hypothetical protein
MCVWVWSSEKSKTFYTYCEQVGRRRKDYETIIFAYTPRFSNWPIPLRLCVQNRVSVTHFLTFGWKKPKWSIIKKFGCVISFVSVVIFLQQFLNFEGKNTFIWEHINCLISLYDKELSIYCVVTASSCVLLRVCKRAYMKKHVWFLNYTNSGTALCKGLTHEL